MRKPRTGFVVAVIGTFVALLTSAGAGAQTTSAPISVVCTSSGQLCSPTFTTPVTTTGLLEVAVTMGAGGCSDVAAHLLVDNVELAVTPFLAPGQTSTTFTLGPVSPGTHTLGVQGEGRVGGCNVGFLQSWGGSVQITVDAPAAVPVPAPGLIATTLLFLVGSFAFLRRRRTRH
jgi:hypothetical protein